MLCGSTIADAEAVRIRLSARSINRSPTDRQRLGDGKRPNARQHSTPWCFDSLGDLNFMEEHLIVIWTIRRIGCWIIGG
jgi:hypothetical protein